MDEPPIDEWLAEDRADADRTSLAVIDPEAKGHGELVACQQLVAAGIPVALSVFERAGATADHAVEDGSAAKHGDVLIEVTGLAAQLLSAERLALNVVMHLSGIATYTRRVVDAVHNVNPNCFVMATRKTTPGLRALEHAAVRAGGGEVHRAELAEALLVKENHLAFTPLGDAIERAREAEPDHFLMVEAETPAEALSITSAGADGVLLDDFGPDQLADAAEAIKILRPDIVVEASGGITLENVADVVRHVDRVSLGALTHSAPAADVSFRLRPLDD